MFNRTMSRQRILQSSAIITRWKNSVKLMGLTVGVVFALGSPVYAQHRGGHHGGFRGGHHGGGYHGGFRHHGLRRHHGGHHGGGRHLGFGHHVDASVVYRPTIHESDHLYRRNYQSSDPTQQRADHGFTAGKRYFKQGKYSLAVEAFQQAVLAAPRDGVPKFYFGLAHFSAGDYEYAAYAIRRGMDRVPSWGKNEMDPRYLYGKSADLDRHLAALTAHVERDPANGDARFLLGYMLYFTGQYAPALEQFDLAMQIGAGDRHAAELRQLAIERTGE